MVILVNCILRIDFRERLAHQHQQGQWRDLKYSTNPARNCTRQWPNSGGSPARCLTSAGVSTVKVTTSTVSMNRTNRKRRTVVWVPVRPCSYRKWCTELPVSFCKPHLFESLFCWRLLLKTRAQKNVWVIHIHVYVLLNLQHARVTVLKKSQASTLKCNTVHVWQITASCTKERWHQIKSMIAIRHYHYDHWFFLV